jgi:Tfp pilus assembly protein PilF
MAALSKKNYLKDVNFNGNIDKIHIGDNDLGEIAEIIRKENAENADEFKKDIVEILDKKLSKIDVLNASKENEIKIDIEPIKKNIEFFKTKGELGVDLSLEGLKKIENEEWDVLDDNTRYDLLTQIGIYSYRKADLEKAANYFLKAFQYDNYSEDALVNAYAACVLLNEFNESIYTHLLRHKPVLAKALEIRFKKQTLTINEIESELTDDELKNSNLLLALSIRASNQDEFDDCIRFSRMNLELEDSISMKENLANALFDKTNNTKKLVFQLKHDSEFSFLIKEAIKLFETCWSELQADILIHRTSIKARQAVLYSLIDEHEKALDAIKLAISYDNENKYFLKYRGFIHFNNFEFNDAIICFDQVTDISLHPEVVFYKAICYLNMDKQDEAIKILSESLSEIEDENYSSIVLRLLSETYANNDYFKEAENLINEYSNRFGNEIALMLTHCLIMHKFGEENEANKKLDELIRGFEDKNDGMTLMYATTLEKIGRNEEAIEFYDKCIDYKNLNDLTLRVLDLNIRYGKKSKALEILRQLRQFNGFIENRSVEEVVHIVETGDYFEAFDLSIKYLDKFPNNFEMILYSSLIALRIGNIEYVQEVLKKDIDVNQISINLLGEYLRLLLKFNYKRKAYDLLYNKWSKDFSPRINDFLFSFFLSFGFPSNLTNNLTVEVGDAVTIEDENRERKVFVLLEKPIESLNRQIGEINSQNDFFSLLIGKGIGDEIVYDETINNHHYKIVQIENKIIYSIRKSQENVDTIFKGESVIRILNKEDLGKLETNNLTNSNSNKELYEKYYSSECPINFLSIEYSIPYIELWDYLTCGKKSKFITANGTVDEIDSAIEILSNNVKNELYLDIYSLRAFYSFKSRDLIAEKFKLFICHRTHENIIQHIEAMSSSFFSFHFLNSGNNSSHAIDEYKSEYNGFLSWVKENVQVKPSKLLLEDSILKINAGDTSYNAFVLAKENNGIAVVDDLYTREALKQNVSANSVWSHALLYFLFKNRESKEQFYSDTIKLINLNYHHIPITADIIFYAYENCELKTTDRFSKVISTLRGKRSSNTAILVGLLFLIKAMTLQEKVRLKIVSLIENILNELFLNRCISDTYELLYFLLLKSYIGNREEVEFLFKVIANYMQRHYPFIEIHPPKLTFFRDYLSYLNQVS